MEILYFSKKRNDWIEIKDISKDIKRKEEEKKLEDLLKLTSEKY